MQEFCVKTTALHSDDAARVSRELRTIRGVASVEVDLSSGWVVARGRGLSESELLAGVRAAGLVVERVLHDPLSPP
jgi:copper chaperone CopZ